MTAFYHDPWLTIHGGDCRDVLATLPEASVHCVVTSPPYWGLRDYGTASWDGGDPSCDHQVGTFDAKRGDRERYSGHDKRPGRECGKCGAVRQDRQLGLEATPEDYVANMVAVFREVRRVLRSDGTLWLNLGDSYSGYHGNARVADDEAPSNKPGYIENMRASTVGVSGLKPKDLVGIPWRVAFALQADGWYLRSDVIWAKPNPMPESVTDRPTKAHEYLFLLTKSPRYWYDADAVREPLEHPNRTGTNPRLAVDNTGLGAHGSAKSGGIDSNPAGRNRRTVWTVATQPYPGAHFAVMPEALVEPCVLAGCPDKACGECGAPWERVVEREVGTDGRKNLGDRERNRGGRTDGLTKLPDGYRVTTTTTGWRPTCAHADAPTVPGVTLDPFGGSGTVARVANRLSRRAVLIDLNPDYLRQQLRRANALPMGL